MQWRHSASVSSVVLYLDRRRPKDLTPCEKVPSIPARLLYICFHSGVRCSILLAAATRIPYEEAGPAFVSSFAVLRAKLIDAAFGAICPREFGMDGDSTGWTLLCHQPVLFLP
jgi:hypothetical protein